MTISREQGQAIAALMHALRPEWDQPGCLAVIGRLINHDATNVAMAAVRLCATPEAKTPGALANLQGGHWLERVSASAMRYPPKRDEACAKHPGEWPDSCRSCAADQLAGDQSAFNPRRSPANEQALALARANLAQAKANLCSHGISPRICQDKHDEPAKEQV